MKKKKCQCQCPSLSCCSSSPSSSCSSSSSSPSSSSSCVGPDSVIPTHHHHHHRHQSQSEKTKPKPKKRARKGHNHQENCLSGNGNNSSGRRSSIYRGVTRHRWTGRFEAHLWDKSSWNNIQNKKGRQVYLGAYDNEEAAAHTYDLAALKYWGPETTLNFPIETYSKELEEMQKVSKEEYLASLRRRSSGFSRGVSKYRGVARHHHNGRWEARIGRVFGNKYLYLGTYNTQEEAAAAYDMAAIEYRGANAVTNFDISNYIDQLKKKGVAIDHILQQQSPNISTKLEETEEAEQIEETGEAEQQQQQEQLHLPPSPSPSPAPTVPSAPSMDVSGILGMDPMEDHHLNWGFCLDPGLNPLPVAQLPLENASCELKDLFDDAGFEDNIDLIFDIPDIDITGCGNEEEVVRVAGNMEEEEEEEENGKDGLFSSSGSSSNSSSPSCSTTTSVSCSFSV